MNINHSFWKNRRVFLTGHTGFKGSWLSLWLETLGAETTGYSLDPPTQPNLFEQASVAKSLRSFHGDIRDYDKLKNALKESRPSVVIHMAAQSVVRHGYADPIETYSTNVMGTVHLFEALRQLKLQCVVVNVTSDKCYANQEWLWAYREYEAMGGRDPYSNSKSCAELVTTAYRESFFPPSAFAEHGIALASARAGNAIGGGDWTPDQLIPDLMRAFLKKEACVIRNPHAIRPWQFVLEPIRGYLMLAEQLSVNPQKFASGWNFGPIDSDARSVSWIADKLAGHWGNGAAWRQDTAQHPTEAQLLKLDASKAGAHLRWHPVVSIEPALHWISEWYRAFRDKSDLRKITSSQIQRYESLLANS